MVVGPVLVDVKRRRSDSDIKRHLHRQRLTPHKEAFADRFDAG